MEPEALLTCLEDPHTSPYPEPDKLNPLFHFLKDPF
jgi:hypothetical protein